MKKIYIVILLLVTFLTVNAQSRLGVKGAFDITSLSTASAKNRMGFNIGGMYSTHITDSWYFQPGLSLAFVGSKSAKKEKLDYSAYCYYLEAPMNFSCRFGDDDISFGVDMGAFFRYGLFGGYWTDTEKEGRIRPNIFDFHKRFDVGPQIGFSAIVSGLYFGYSFQFGLIKPWENRRGNYYSSGINIGYLFEIN